MAENGRDLILSFLEWEVYSTIYLLMINESRYLSTYNPYLDRLEMHLRASEGYTLYEVAQKIWLHNFNHK